MTLDEARVPVVVASGQSIDRDATVTALELAVRAAQECFDTAPRLRDRVGLVSVVNIMSSTTPAAGAVLARRLGLSPTRTEATTIGGNSPQWLVSRAASAISAGALDATLIVGAEAQHSAKAGGPPDPGHDTGAPDAVIGDERPGVGDAELGVGIIAPVHVYALFESVIAHRARRRAPEHRAVLGELMARFTEVAATQRAAWFPVARAPTELATIGPDNRLVAEPYPKRMCAFLHVNQGAAVLVTSLATARAAGVAERAVFCWSGAEVSDVWFPSARPDLGSSPGLRAAATAASAEPVAPSTRSTPSTCTRASRARSRWEPRHSGSPPTIRGASP